MPTDNDATCFFPPFCWACASQASLLAPCCSWLCGSWNTCSCDFGWLTLLMVIDTLLAEYADHTFCLLWFAVLCKPTPHIADNATIYQALNSCINLINIGVLQGGFFVFCKLGWGEADVFIGVRGHDYDWVVVVESLFDIQINKDIIGVNKRSFAVHITQVTLRKCCRMIKSKLIFKKPNFFWLCKKIVFLIKN